MLVGADWGMISRGTRGLGEREDGLMATRTLLKGTACIFVVACSNEEGGLCLR